MKPLTAAARLGVLILSLSKPGWAVPGSEIFAKRVDPVCSHSCTVFASVDEWSWVPFKKTYSFTAYHHVVYINNATHTNSTSTVWHDIPSTSVPPLQTDPINKRNVNIIAYTGPDGDTTSTSVSVPSSSASLPVSPTILTLLQCLPNHVLRLEQQVRRHGRIRRCSHRRFSIVYDSL